ncbi:MULTISPECIES: DUF2827 family protein [unclassified Variovorax]|uniref:DUF2827 family protein n=1 Tax=unclassified Variovorax TaxID=663243 RepID=UPI0008D0781E|nr:MULTISPECIES: DUF2827 family protein [unclassified Variovorax]SEJ19157.1 Protein of unknown function [Variovorax sp. OK202]SFC10095.1 Protein of unknown function [Variovorax sp. OK212]
MHNAHLCADLGYHYEGNDVAGGSARVLEAVDSHDAQALAYRERQRGLIDRYLPGNAAATEVYNALLLGLVQRPAR